MTLRQQRLLAAIGLVVALVVGGYCLVGVLMAGAATQSNPANVESYRVSAWVYLSGMSASIAAAVVAFAFLMRRRYE